MQYIYDKEYHPQVNHPSHYNSGKIEVIEAIEDWKLNFHRGNAVKYTARAGKKDQAKEIEDLEKAVWYLKREIETLKAKQENRDAIKPNDMNSKPPAVSASGKGSTLFDTINSPNTVQYYGVWIQTADGEICFSPNEITSALKDLIDKWGMLYFVPGATA